MAGSSEQFFLGLHGLLRPALRRLLDGQPWISLEVAGRSGHAQLQIWIPTGEKAFIESLLQAAYPGSSLSSAGSPSTDIRPNGLADFRLARGNYVPIRTAFDGEPLSTLLSTLARATVVTRSGCSSSSGHERRVGRPQPTRRRNGSGTAGSAAQLPGRPATARRRNLSAIGPGRLRTRRRASGSTVFCASLRSQSRPSARVSCYGRSPQVCGPTPQRIASRTAGSCVRAASRTSSDSASCRVRVPFSSRRVNSPGCGTCRPTRRAT